MLQISVISKVQRVQQQQASLEKKQFVLQFQKETDHKREEVQDTKEKKQIIILEGKKRENQKEKRNLNQGAESKSRSRKDPVWELDRGKILDLVV